MCSSSLLSCPLCCLSNFPDLETFKLNLIKVNSKPIKCPFPSCNEILLGLDKLTIHLFGHSLPVVENGISPAVDSSSQQQQQQQQTQKSKRNDLPAKHANNNTRTKLVKSSSNTQVKVSEESFRCEICGFIFNDENLLNLHLSLVHNFTPSNNTDNVDNNNDDDENAQSSKNEIKKFQCHLCSKHFKMKGALRIHIRVAHIKFQDQNKRQINIANYLKTQKMLSKAKTENQLDQCMLQTEMLTLQDPLSPSASIASSPLSYMAPSPQNLLETPVKSPKIFQCDECKKTFTTKYFLKKHKRMHTGEMPYSCEQCGKSFFFQQSYHKHLNYHNDEKPYECTECGRSFKELSTLHNHQRIHSGDKPFGCEICGKFFRQRVSYLVHTRIHTGVLPYKCTECGKGFRYKVSQRSHKCSGVVEQQPESPGEVIQKLMQNSSISQTQNSSNSTITSAAQHLNGAAVSNETTTTNVIEISICNQQQIAPHELCFEDLLKDDSYEKLMKGCSNVVENHHQFIPIANLSDDNFDPSSVLEFHNNNNNNNNNNYHTNNLTTTINSNYDLSCENTTNNFNSNFHSALETINEDSIKELLGALR